MPRSLLEILLEKKTELPIKSSDEFYTRLDDLEAFCMNIMSEVQGIKGSSGFLEIESLGTLKSNIEDSLKTLRKYRDNWEEYRWNDPGVQDKIIEIEEQIKGEDPKVIGGYIKDLADARIEALGKDDALRIGNTYFETAEALREKASQKIFSVASIRDKEIKVDKRLANSDIAEQNNFDSDKIDIVAKKKEGATDEETKKIAKENAKLKNGLFYFLGMILGQTKEEVKTNWGGVEMKDGVEVSVDPTQKQKDYRKEVLAKAVPYIESITKKDYDEKNPYLDKQYMSDVMILASYTPEYKNYEPDPEESEEEVVITDAEYKVIEKEMKAKKDEIIALLNKLKASNSGSGAKQEKITEMADLAIKELNLVEDKTACSSYSMSKLRASKKEMETNVGLYANLLDKEKDLAPINEIGIIIDKIIAYCRGKNYKTS
jgi:hypothetical protein